MDKIILEIVGLSYSQSQNGAYALILGENCGQRKLPIIIGTTEAQCIAMGMEKVKSNRPLTHDLFKTLTDEFDLHLKEVIINKFKEGVFFSNLVFEGHGQTCYIDARPSDAISLAVRYGCNIYASANVLDEAGIVIDDIEDDEEELDDDMIEEVESLEYYTIEELINLQEAAIQSEDYARAAEIRDELNKRNRDTK